MANLWPVLRLAPLLLAAVLLPGATSAAPASGDSVTTRQPFSYTKVIVDLGVLAEESGWDGVFLWDHAHGSPAMPAAEANQRSVSARAGAPSRASRGSAAAITSPSGWW